VNGARACNVFWQITSSASLGSGSTFVGTIMAMTSITMADDVTVDGRALARNGNVTLINDTITSSTCEIVTETGTGASPPESAPGSAPVVPLLPNAALFDENPATPGALVVVFGAVALLSAVMIVGVKRSRDRA
jgi:hypothetical protein